MDQEGATSASQNESSGTDVATLSRERGNFWEITYQRRCEEFPAWELAKRSDLATETGKTEVEVNAQKDTRAINLSSKTFKTCDFNHFSLADSSFSGCTFVGCRFIKADLKNVKFSKCTFTQCHFLNVHFSSCQFIACRFSQISASAEQLRFEETRISARAFVDAVVTNTNELPQGTTAAYQEHRLLTTKARIARAIFISVRNDPELDQVFDANRCFEISLQRQRIATAYWKAAGSKLVKEGRLSRYLVGPSRWVFLAIIQTAGFFTDWGRSPLKSGWFLVAAIVLFAGVYHFGFQQESGAALLRALDCTFVFGYTKYASPVDQNTVLHAAMFANAFCGFCWYALLIPALSKRLFR